MSVRQPFAQLLARGIKPVENRSKWRPPQWAMWSPEEVWIAFHAARTVASKADTLTALERAYPAAVDQEAVRVLLQAGYPRGAIVGAARFVGWIDSQSFYWARSCNEYGSLVGSERWDSSPWRSLGLHGLCFADAVEFSEPFIGVPGQQAVWWDPDKVPLHKAPPQAAIEERIKAGGR